MTLNVKIQHPVFDGPRPNFGAKIDPIAWGTASGTFLDTLADFGGPESIAALKNQRVRKFTPTIVEPLKKLEKVPGPPSPRSLKRMLGWLQKSLRPRPTKQLQVAETVSLGEKRFVAILDVEGRKYLIGGGASSVCLLTQLDAANESTEPELPVKCLHEVR